MVDQPEGSQKLTLAYLLEGLEIMSNCNPKTVQWHIHPHVWLLYRMGAKGTARSYRRKWRASKNTGREGYMNDIRHDYIRKSRYSGQYWRDFDFPVVE